MRWKFDCSAVVSYPLGGISACNIRFLRVDFEASNTVVLDAVEPFAYLAHPPRIETVTGLNVERAVLVT
jgi:hypothetical protein